MNDKGVPVKRAPLNHKKFIFSVFFGSYSLTILFLQFYIEVVIPFISAKDKNDRNIFCCQHVDYYGINLYLCVEMEMLYLENERTDEIR